ncbi:MAG: zinc ribbon domain-containing protein [Azoarcus sp.]|nr:zinc ribbon domain-containing protein [Azoarcus sp.]
MPIYEYRCEHCGFQKEHLQKMNDAVLTVCPSCNNDRYVRQLSVAGFQLKGSGWYATDFKCPASSGKNEDAPATALPCGGSCACHSS